MSWAAESNCNGLVQGWAEAEAEDEGRGWADTERQRERGARYRHCVMTRAPKVRDRWVGVGEPVSAFGVSELGGGLRRSY